MENIFVTLWLKLSHMKREIWWSLLNWLLYLKVDMLDILDGISISVFVCMYAASGSICLIFLLNIKSFLLSLSFASFQILWNFKGDWSFFRTHNPLLAFPCIELLWHLNIIGIWNWCPSLWRWCCHSRSHGILWSWD